MRSGLCIALSVFLLVPAAQVARSETLPPLERRHIIGTWLDKGQGCTLSIEQVATGVFEVWRCKDGSGGDEGRPLMRGPAEVFRPQPAPASGMRYVRMESGELVIRDDEGLIRSLPGYTHLWPDSDDIRLRASPREAPVTLRFSCYELGYRYGFAAVGALRGQPVNALWGQQPPPRCREDAATERGMRDGARAQR